jgi:hypothetical protein
LRRPIAQVSRNHQHQKNHLTTFSICGTNADGLQCLYVVIADGKDDDPSKDREAQDEGDVTLLFSRVFKTYFLTTNFCFVGLDPPVIRQISDMAKGNGQCSVYFSSVIITMAVTTLWRHGFHFRKGVFRAFSFFLAGVEPSVIPADSDIEMEHGEYSLYFRVVIIGMPVISYPSTLFINVCTHFHQIWIERHHMENPFMT